MHMDDKDKKIDTVTTPDENTAAEPREETPREAAEKKEKGKRKKKAKGSLKSFLKSRKAKHGTVAAAIVAMVIAAVILVNVVCGILVDRFPSLSFDLTANQVFALQEDTEDYISHLDKDINVYVLMTEENFTSNGSYFVQAQKLLKQMVSKTDHMKLEYVDLSKNPTFTSNYTDVDWTIQENLFLVESGDQYRCLTVSDCFEYDEQTYYYYGQYDFTGSNVEQQIVTAILNVTTEDKPIIDFITGNQEQDYSSLTSLLESNAYQINEISLATSDLDEDAKIAVLFAPAVDLDDATAEKLNNWLENDGDYGRSLIYVANFEVQETPNLNAFLNKWGMSMADGVLFESDSNYLVTNQPFISLTNYNDVFTDGLKNSSIPCLSSYTRAINIEDESVAKAVLTTSSASGIMPYSEANNENWNYKEAITGSPLNAAAMGTQKNTEEVASNVVVFGSYNMFASSVLSYNSYNNSAFVLNMVNTLADRDDMGISIEGKTIDNSELGIDLSAQNALMVLFVILVPIAALAAGLVIWVRRRNK